MIFFFDQEIYIILIRSIELYCYNHNVKIKETKTEVEKWRCKLIDVPYTILIICIWAWQLSYNKVRQ